jgi:metallo-beta-lactamase class B
MNRSWFLLAAAIAVHAATPPEWVRTTEPFRIVDNIYYVGTEDLACYLVTGSAGHILINSALAESTANTLANVEKLGFRVRDIKILLTNQAHYDHAAGLAEIRRKTGAKMFATPPDAVLLETGGALKRGGPPQFAGFDPVKVDRELKDGETIRLGKTELKVHYHYGHTPGSSSYETTVNDGGSTRTFLFANMGTVVMPLTSPDYPKIVDDFRATFAQQKRLSPEIWVASHASQFGMFDKKKKGSFADPGGYREAVEKHEKRFERQAKIELGR